MRKLVGLVVACGSLAVPGTAMASDHGTATAINANQTQQEALAFAGNGGYATALNINVTTQTAVALALGGGDATAVNINETQQEEAAASGIVVR